MIAHADEQALTVLRRPKATTDMEKPRCAGCGEVFRPSWAESDARDPARFCSRSCEEK